MAGGKAKNNALKVGLGEAGDTATTRRVGPQGVENVLQGGGTSEITVWFGDLGPFGGNGEKGRRSTHDFSQTNHGEVSAADSRRDIGDALGRSSAGSGRNTAVNELYMETTSNRDTVGGVATNIQSVCRGEGIQGGWAQDGGLVTLRGDREATSGNLDRSLTGSKEEEDTGRDSHTVGDRGRW